MCLAATRRAVKYKRPERPIRPPVDPVDGERGEDGVDLALEDLDEVLAVVVIEGGPVGEADAGRGEGGDDEVQEGREYGPTAPNR